MDNHIFAKYYSEKEVMYQSSSAIDLPTYIQSEMERCTDHARTTLPMIVGLKITEQCNFQCPHCFSSMKLKKQMNLKEVIKIIESFEGNLPYRIYLTGGEPLLNDHLLEIIKYLKSLRVNITIHTNGSLITNDFVDRLSKLFGYNDSVQVSIDGHCKALFEEIRVFSNFEDVISGTKVLLDKGIDVRVNTVVTNKTVNYLYDIYKFVEKLGITKISFSPLFNISDSSNTYLPNDEIILQNFSKVLEYYLTSNKALKITQDPIAVPWGNEKVSEFHINSCHICPAGKTAIEINPFGEAFPCPYIHSSEYSMGNVLEEGISKVWNINRQSVFSLKRWSNNKTCNECGSVEFCRSGCLAIASLSNEDYDVRCSKHITKEVVTV